MKAMCRQKLCIIFSSLIISAPHISYPVTLENQTDKNFYAAFYYVKSTPSGSSTGPAVLAGNIVEVKQKNQVKLERPPYKIVTDNREIIVSKDKKDLEKDLTKEKYNAARKIPAGVKYGETFYIVEKDGKIHTLSIIEKIAFDSADKIQNMITQLSTDAKKYLNKNPYKDKPAQVTKRDTQNPLDPEEQKVVDTRLADARTHLNTKFKNIIPENKKIGIHMALSGGGMRAVVCSQALYEALEELDLLKAITYSVGLSGSTWFVAALAQSNLPLKDFIPYIKETVTVSGLPSAESLFDIGLQRLISKQPLDLNVLFGAFLSYKFFKFIRNETEKQSLHFSDIAKNLVNKPDIIPMITAIDFTVSRKNSNWVSFTPFCTFFGATKSSIPTWAFGRSFSEGFSTNFIPEQSSGYLLSTCGSALAGTIGQMFYSAKKTIKNEIFKDTMASILKNTVGTEYLLPIKIDNPFYGLEEPYKNTPQLSFEDGGYNCMLPVAPLYLHTNGYVPINILFVLDVSDSLMTNPTPNEYFNAQTKLEKINIPFPKLDKDDQKKAIMILTDKNPKTPLVIYVCPLRTMKGENLQKKYNSANMTYSEQDYSKLLDHTKKCVLERKDDIFKAIEEKIKLTTNI